MTAERPKIYLAGPDVFHDDAQDIGARKKALCAARGFEGLFPLDNEIVAVGASKPEIAGQIYDANIAMLDAADAVIANVTPFLGACADDGTAFEIGYAVARGLPITLYDNGVGDTAAKAAALRSVAPSLLGAAMEAEDFGLPVNLMMAVPALRRCPIATGPEPLPLGDLTRFEIALDRVADSLR